MNALRKKAAIKTYKAQFEAGDDVVSLLKEDEKKYSDDEIAEIIGSFEAAQTDAVPEGLYYQEWEVKISSVKNEFVAEKLKIKRPVVRITDDEAEILNTGVLQGGNNYAVMYFLPE